MIKVLIRTEHQRPTCASWVTIFNYLHWALVIVRKRVFWAGEPSHGCLSPFPNYACPHPSEGAGLEVVGRTHTFRFSLPSSSKRK
jgi:hypothetical protein